MHPRPATVPASLSQPASQPASLSVPASVTVWQALARPYYLLSPWPWRAAAYLLTGAVTGVVVLVGLVALVAVGGVLAVVLVGLPLLALVAFAGLPVAALERRRLRLVDADDAPGTHVEPPRPVFAAGSPPA